MMQTPKNKNTAILLFIFMHRLWYFSSAPGLGCSQVGARRVESGFLLNNYFAVPVQSTAG